MGVSLYRKGNTHVIRGVECEMQSFSVSSMAGAIKSGWFSSPGAAYKAEEADTNKSGKLSNEEVRVAAKEAGIDDWDKKRIKNLKAELGYV